MFYIDVIKAYNKIKALECIELMLKESHALWVDEIERLNLKDKLLALDEEKLTIFIKFYLDFKEGRHKEITIATFKDLINRHLRG